MDGSKQGCCCSTLPDLAAVPMGGDGLDECVFATVENVADHGGGLWWLHLSKCIECGQHWMVAQEERIFDEYFMRRLVEQQAQDILEDGRWAEEFTTYENVLKIGRSLSSPCIYLDSMSPALIQSASDLREARPSITVDEIAYLLGVTERNAGRLLAA